MSDLHIPDHPDAARALVTGYPAFQHPENQDTPEARLEYVREHALEFINYIRLAAPEELDSFCEFSSQHCHTSYESWLN